MRKLLGVNIDHIATLRQVRGENYPDPVQAAVFVELAGADGITVHLREDRRHIQERDIRLLKETLKIPLNMEMALSREILNIALEVRPDEVCIVPEKRQEVTTEGGLDVLKHQEELSHSIPLLQEQNIEVSLFVEPDPEIIQISAELNANAVELHTGAYANAATQEKRELELRRIHQAVHLGHSLGLKVNAGHGLNYQNTLPIAEITNITTLNIGHSIISRAVYVGLEKAVRDMISILDQAIINQK